MAENRSKKFKLGGEDDTLSHFVRHKQEQESKLKNKTVAMKPLSAQRFYNKINSHLQHALNIVEIKDLGERHKACTKLVGDLKEIIERFAATCPEEFKKTEAASQIQEIVLGYEKSLVQVSRINAPNLATGRDGSAPLSESEKQKILAQPYGQAKYKSMEAILEKERAFADGMKSTAMRQVLGGICEHLRNAAEFLLGHKLVKEQKRYNLQEKAAHHVGRSNRHR